MIWRRSARLQTKSADKFNMRLSGVGSFKANTSDLLIYLAEIFEENVMRSHGLIV